MFNSKQKIWTTAKYYVQMKDKYWKDAQDY